jgi:hypothetical protein
MPLKTVLIPLPNEAKSKRVSYLYLSDLYYVFLYFQFNMRPVSVLLAAGRVLQQPGVTGRDNR